MSTPAKEWSPNFARGFILGTLLGAPIFFLGSVLTGHPVLAVEYLLIFGLTTFMWWHG